MHGQVGIDLVGRQGLAQEAIGAGDGLARRPSVQSGTPTTSTPLPARKARRENDSLGPLISAPSRVAGGAQHRADDAVVAAAAAQVAGERVAHLLAVGRGVVASSAFALMMMPAVQ